MRGCRTKSTTPLFSFCTRRGRFLFNIHEDHAISLMADASKLLVPTPPVYERDSVTGDYTIVRGKEPPESVLLGMIQSFCDVPGVMREDESNSVFLEEIYEIAWSIGGEYRYNEHFAIRSGYFHEHASKGNRKYFPVGLGAEFRFLTLDVSYLRPTNGYSSLMNTYRITVTTEFGK